MIRNHWVWTSAGSMLSMREESTGAKLKRMVFETISWLLSELRKPTDGVAVDKSSSTSRLRVGSQPTLEIGKDCAVIVGVFVVRNVPEIHVGF